MRRFVLCAVLVSALLPASAAAEPPAGAPGCPPGFFLVIVEPGTPPDRNENGLVCNNANGVVIDDRVGASSP
jgi:hypothetical protein